MNIIFLCGYFEENYNKFIIEHAKKNVEFSANLFQGKLIDGLDLNGYNYKVLSAPFIGSYPNYSNIKFFRNVKSQNDKIKYISFNNIWGIRNLSREIACRKALKKALSFTEQNLIIVYSVHTPFVKASAWAKKKFGNVDVCLICLDLPQYMNLSLNVSFVYKIAKKLDIKSFLKANSFVDSYVLLTEHMNKIINKDNKPNIVIEGLYSPKAKTINEPQKNKKKRIVYTGKLEKKFGIVNLIDAFCLIHSYDYELVICGDGEARDYLIEKATDNTNIIYLGTVEPRKAQEIVESADVLVNPRQNNDIYTRYSFPSKNIEYLSSGKPVIGYELDGMPKKYAEFMYYVEGNTVIDLKNKIIEVLEMDPIKKKIKSNEAIKYFKENLDKMIVVRKIISLNNS